MIYIRRPTLHDLNECARLDASFTTHKVWQMHLQVDEGRIQVHFHRVHLPRAMKVPVPPEARDMTKAWQRGDGIYAARRGNTILGYIHIEVDQETKTGYIHRHVVAPEFRRQGVGTALLERAVEWCRERRLQGIEVALSTKNHPAIEFYLARGFVFTGFSEHLWDSQEILMHFSRVTR
ncbi:MAG TPA: GNAT family N-acetyltransferase [Anaerolineae bacterium]|nr:GNAT family N-acetyltransferase [Anaerolineae bacterium]